MGVTTTVNEIARHAGVAPVLEEAVRVTRAAKQGLTCDGVYLSQANGNPAGRDVLHYHLHVYPCWGDRARRATGGFVRSASAEGRGRASEGKAR